MNPLPLEVIPLLTSFFARVLGGKISNIDGLVQTQGLNADLFLLNPHGIVFGPNSNLNVNGSFFATTAESILFDDDDLPFSVNQSDSNPMLTSSLPIGLRFGRSPGPIVNRSSFQRPLFPFPGIPPSFVGLEAKSGFTLAFLGGDIDMREAFVTTRNGSINISSIGGYSTVNLKLLSSNQWKISYNGVNIFSDLKLINTQINSTGLSGGSGSIDIHGQNISLTNKTRITAFNGDNPQVGNIRVRAIEKLTLKDRASIQTRAFGDRAGGNISIKANIIEIDSIFPDDSFFYWFICDYDLRICSVGR
ncbi:filamentous hemagglutinin N-terminal domain-containing protein [Acaryochloris sp. 'Moss Beach']|uniref:two-partner secretion domain-containing protein n=1 Tax=Acaryochloris sp. 'Moss Beach' TaxID=2740837 RepID=UPI001F1F2D85|nr:filamentous hemagglutinin N-terminal domain-containing protein [Acaryochloris sp. 'Moss Beach']UJB68961.1 filamentous hemagglutinin N-terminal domain-containing protein [Acaryochloris sp. 'Moss Beach']